MVSQTPSEEPTKFQAAIVVVVTLIMLPLPGALLYAGTEWLFNPAGVSQKFIATYFGQILILIGWGLWAKFNAGN